jgi:HD superfamily phosphohydrolase
MKILYTCSCADECNEYYTNQAGNGLSFYSGIHNQKGYGIFSNIMRYAIPFIKKSLINLGKHGINAASNVIDDIESGKTVNEALATRTRETIDKIQNEILNKVQSFTQEGRGRKRKLATNKNKPPQNKKRKLQNKTSTAKVVKKQKKKKITKKSKPNLKKETKKVIKKQTNLPKKKTNKALQLESLFARRSCINKKKK